MNRIPQIVPVSDMSIKQQDTLKLLDNGPVILATRSRPTAVLISVAEWDALINEIEVLRDLVDVQEADLNLSTGEPEDFDMDELRQMAGHAVHA